MAAGELPRLAGLEGFEVWEDSYELDTGYWSHSTEHQTKKLTMKIVFHRHRTCKDVRGTISYAGEVSEQIPKHVLVSSNNREAKLEVSNPKLGAEYILEWHW